MLFQRGLGLIHSEKKIYQRFMGILSHPQITPLSSCFNYTLRTTYSKKLRTNLFILIQFSAPTDEDESMTTTKSTTRFGGHGTANNRKLNVVCKNIGIVFNFFIFY